MKNIEKYSKKLMEGIGVHVERPLCAEFIAPVILKSFGKTCATTSCYECRKLRIAWANEEYKEPKVDWSKVPVDAPIYVRDNENAPWEPKHFAKYEKGNVYTWSGGRTSHTAAETGGVYMHSWIFTKLASPEQEENDER